MYPGVITSYSGDIVVTPQIDEQVQGWVVTRFGKQFGVYLDDTTPLLDSWVAKAVKKYGPLGQTVFVSVSTGNAGLHHHPHPPVVNLYEWYPYGEGVDPNEFTLPAHYEGYIVQWNFPGITGRHVPTPEQREELLAQVQAMNPKYIFLY